MIWKNIHFLLMFDIFKRYTNLVVVMSTIEDGDLREEEARAATKVNREAYARKQGIEPRFLIAADLVHGNKVAIVSAADGGIVIPKTDGLLTRDQDIFLSVTAADCLPIFFYDPKREIVGIAHAGWRGLARGVVLNMVEAIREKFGSIESDILVGVGPGIGECHYDVKEEVADQFADFSEAIVYRKEKVFLDLKKIASLQLQNAGLTEKNIEIHPACTYCKGETYFSYRRDRPEKVQAMMAVIGMRK